MIERWRERWRRFAGRGVYPHQLAFLLLLPFRRLQLSPRKLIAQLGLDPAAQVIELGCGPGFFSADVARALSRGRLTAADLQPEMLFQARRRLRRAGVENVRYVACDGAALPFAAASFDLAFAVAMLGEVHDPRACVAAVARALVPAGRLVVAELPGDPDRLKIEQVTALARASGLEPARTASIGGGFVAAFERRKR